MVVKFGVRFGAMRHSSCNRGAALVEYVLLVAILVSSLISAMQSVGDQTKKSFLTVCQAVEQGGGSCSTTGDDRGPPGREEPIIRP